jgi:DNA-binding NtrC family response regulator
MVRTVLLVDDDLWILRALLRRLRKGAYEIRTATSGEEALGVLERAKVDLIVSDWRMPVMSGTEFLARVAQKHPRCSRIMLTGHADLPSAMAAINSGVIHRFLNKPCDPSTLVSIIDEVLQQA